MLVPVSVLLFPIVFLVGNSTKLGTIAPRGHFIFEQSLDGVTSSCWNAPRITQPIPLIPLEWPMHCPAAVLPYLERSQCLLFFINVTIHSYRRLPFPRIVHSSSSVHYSSKHLYITAALPSPFLTPPTNHSLLTPAPA